MSILIDKNTRVVCQGITGKIGEFDAGCKVVIAITEPPSK
jgi:succinyl-CoA synthetase alpha subunit